MSKMKPLCGMGVIGAALLVASACGAPEELGQGGEPLTNPNLLLNPGFESGPVNWTATSGVITNSVAAHSGSWSAYLCGYGTTHTDSVYQDVAISSNITSATLSYWLKITTAETGTTPYDFLRVQVRNTSNAVLGTTATYSNVNAGAGYSQRLADITAYKGQMVRIYFTCTEDSSLQTSFFIDDVSVTVQ